jgi:hypothetical protein
MADSFLIKYGLIALISSTRVCVKVREVGNIGENEKKGAKPLSLTLEFFGVNDGT